MKHGKRNTRIYRIYAHMKGRCNNPNNEDYCYYGGKGIKVCSLWSEDFQSFYDWSMANGYADDLTIDRINVDGDYEPSNCRWVTMKTQCNNKSSNILITYNGKSQNLKQWAEELGVSYTMLYQRLYKYGWDVEKAFTYDGVGNRRMITYNGKTQTLKQWAIELGVNYQTLSARLNQYHWSTEKAFSTP